jgi:hypothetical protein
MTKERAVVDRSRFEGECCGIPHLAKNEMWGTRWL